MDGDIIHIPPFTAIYMPAHHPHEYYPDGDVWDIHWVVPSGYAAEDILKVTSKNPCTKEKKSGKIEI